MLSRCAERRAWACANCLLALVAVAYISDSQPVSYDTQPLSPLVTGHYALFPFLSTIARSSPSLIRHLRTEAALLPASRHLTWCQMRVDPQHPCLTLNMRLEDILKADAK